MAATTVVPDTPSATASASLVAHALVYLVVLVAVTAILPLDGSLGADDGAYGGQVYALQNGGWALERPLPVVDAANEGWFNSAITPAGPLPYTSNPGYALLLTVVASAAARVGGAVPGTGSGADNALALQLVPVAGAMLAAISAWMSADRLDRRVGPLAFWLVALGPVVVNATSLWAHSLSTGLAGFSAVALVAILTRATPWPRPGAWLGYGLPLAGAAAIRTEAILWIVAISVAVVVADRRRSTLIPVGGGSLVAATVWAANRAWGTALRADRLPIVTSIEELEGSPGWLASRVPAGWELLVSSREPGPGPILVVAALTLVVYGSVLLRRSFDHPVDREPSSVVVVALAGAGVLYLVAASLVGGALVAGTMAAWPALILLAAAGTSRVGRWRSRPDVAGTSQVGRRSCPDVDGAGRAGRRTSRPDHRPAPTTVLTVAVVVFTGAILLTQYAGSGGLQWGGRYLSMAFVPAGAVAATVGYPVWQRARPVVAGLLVAPALLGLAGSYHLHVAHRDVMAAVTERPTEVIVSDLPPLTRIGWTVLPTAIYRADDDSIEPLLTDLADGGVSTVTVLGLDDVDLDGLAGYRVDAENGPGGVRYLVRSDPAG